MSPTQWNRSALFVGIALLAPIIDQRWVSTSLAAETPVASQATSGNARNQDAGKPLSAANSDDSAPCVLLRNDNVLFGTARQLGEFVIVQTSQGGEIRLDRQSVQCWSSSLRNLYRYRVDRRQEGDLSALVQDARWCLRYDLHDLAAQEILKIRSIDPRNYEAQKLEDQLRRQYMAFTSASRSSDSTPTEAGHTWKGPAGNDSDAPIRIVGYQDPNHDQALKPHQGAAGNAVIDASESEVDVVNETEAVGAVDGTTLRRFASHIQPMLTNRCGRCHDAGADESRGFSILLPSAGTRASSRTTRENLNATLRHVDPDSPEQSVLLIKATSAHGGEPAALDARNAKAIESLRGWLWMVSASMIRSGTPSRSTEVTVQRPSTDAASTNADSKPPSTQENIHQPAPEKKSQSGDAPLPSRLPHVDNPFDPELFNRLTVEAKP